MEENPKRERGEWTRWLERGDALAYALVGVTFLLLGSVAFVYGWIVFITTASSGLPRAIFVMINDMLLVLIVLEMLGTILNYMKIRTILLEPFLYIGIIASIRRILSSGAHFSITEPVSEIGFSQYLWDVGVNAGVIILLALAVLILGKKK